MAERNEETSMAVRATLQAFPQFIAIGVLAFVGLSQHAQAATLYSQPWNATGDVLASQDDVSPGGQGAYATVYDNFTLASGGTISGVDWTGGYFNPSTKGAVESFTISIYANSGGQPGAALYSESIAGDAGEKSLGTYTNPIFSYAASANFTAAAGVEYWLSVVAVTDGNPQWGWSDGTGGNGSSEQLFYGTLYTNPTDLAFTLSSTPLPAALPLFAGGLGALGLLGGRRKRKGAAAVTIA
jgi:hypothetical protein